MMRAHRLLFTVSVTAISRILVLRDRLLGRLRSPDGDASHAPAVHHRIPSGNAGLDAVFVLPARGPARAALLICHGIGEIVDHWLPVQRLLAAHGIASLVFDYSGYGKSSGWVDWSQCEHDAVSAFRFLKVQAPELPVSILGFSMGSGIVATVLSRVDASHVILCSAFTSFRDAACVLGVPRWLRSMVPLIWDGRESLRKYDRILVLHCAEDRVFPVTMAAELASWCGEKGELVMIPGQQHNEPFYRPQWSYWEQVVSRLADGT